jgi:hypothetical protein
MGETGRQPARIPPAAFQTAGGSMKSSADLYDRK